MVYAYNECGHVSHPQFPPLTTYSPSQTLSYPPVCGCVFETPWVYLGLLVWAYVGDYLLVHGRFTRGYTTEEIGTCSLGVMRNFKHLEGGNL